MRTADRVSAEKLRGGFYTPQRLVRTCLDRAVELLGDRAGLAVLEPSAGDGAFLAGLAGHALGTRVARVTAVELVPAEAARCAERLAASGLAGDVVAGSALDVLPARDECYDVAVGNPPFVRFQFVSDADRAAASALVGRLGLPAAGVANLWVPVVLAAVAAVRPGGVFSFVLPAESFTGVSAHALRQWLLGRVEAVHVDLFAPGSFPGVLQEVVVLSGRVGPDGAARRDVHLREHGAGGREWTEWTHRGVGDVRTWTRLVLPPATLEVLDAAAALPSVERLGQLARFEVATVTGANGFFCVDDATAAAFDLRPWLVPLLPRTRHAPGMVLTAADHAALAERGMPAWMVEMSADRPDPATSPAAARYLAGGEADGLHLRFKTRIRSPWYRVPVVAPGRLLMAKRSHRHPRVVLNEAGVVTTDTIYRGRMLPAAPVTAEAFAVTFHNSLTLLSAELEGRSFGGGVLELVPSEISRLLVPVLPSAADELSRLDALARQGPVETGRAVVEAGRTLVEAGRALVEATDDLLARALPEWGDGLLDTARSAGDRLRGLRLARGQGPEPDPDAA